MAESLLSISRTASILEASHLIKDSEIHSLLVEESGKYIGIITNHYISKKWVTESPDQEKVQVAEFIGFPLIKVESQ
jgi:predicted transcriptional regulator